MCPEGVTFNILFVCLFKLYSVSPCVVPTMTCTTNKHIIVIPWAVKDVTVGKAPPLSLQPTTHEWAGCLQWGMLPTGLLCLVFYKEEKLNKQHISTLSSSFLVCYLHCLACWIQLTESTFCEQYIPQKTAKVYIKTESWQYISKHKIHCYTTQFPVNTEAIGQASFWVISRPGQSQGLLYKHRR